MEVTKAIAHLPRSSISVCRLLFSTHDKLRSVHLLHGGPLPSMIHLILQAALVTHCGLLRETYLLLATSCTRLDLPRNGRSRNIGRRFGNALSGHRRYGGIGPILRRLVNVRLRPRSLRHCVRRKVEAQKQFDCNFAGIGAAHGHERPSARMHCRSTKSGDGIASRA